jgi:hypothetical protein
VDSANGAAIPGGDAERVCRASYPSVIGPTITALLEDGPMQDSSIDVEVIEGRPPKTLDLTADDGRTFRYVLATWMQSGDSARYTFLYPV